MVYLIIIFVVLIFIYVVRTSLKYMDVAKVYSNDGDDDHTSSPFKVGPLDTDFEHFPE